jgi:phosphinothricin acetyltransferase
VYVHKDHRGEGLGRRLLELIIDAAKQRELHVMIGGITADNIGSIELHKKLGFVHVGTLPEVGFKFGQWQDLAFYQLTIDSPAHPVDG